MSDKVSDTPYYAGDEYADLSKHDGGLRLAVGASNYQVTRANRKYPEFSDGFGFTYNHAPMITYWKKRFYLQYLCNKVSEHTGGGMSMLASSCDGISWEKPQVSFPIIKVPAGYYNCSDGTVINVPEEKEAFMHQRMAFYQAPNGRLLVTGFYGHAPHHDICPWQNYGIGRAVREIYEDGSLGQIYYLRYLDYSGWTEERLQFPVYSRSLDKGFIEACDSLLKDKLVTQQWAEEHGNEDDCVKLKAPLAKIQEVKDGFVPNLPYEAASSFCWYHIDENTVIALWKQSKVGRSDDGGDTWTIKEEPSFATSGAKSWGQKTGDGKYAIAYDNSLSSEHRYPLVTVTSEDGIRFDGMSVVFGEVPPKRYEGIYKDWGPQYIRGIIEGNTEYPENAMWLCHSVNKEDIFVSRIPVPIVRAVEDDISDDFEVSEGTYIRDWNIYSPVWANVRAVRLHDGTACMKLSDSDPLDYAKAVRIFPSSERIEVSLDFMCVESYVECLEIELTNGKGISACRIKIGNGQVVVKYGANEYPAFDLSPAARWHNLSINIDCPNNNYYVSLDGKRYEQEVLPRLMQKVNNVERLVIRTKPVRYLPNLEIYPETPDIPDSDTQVDERVYYIKNVKTSRIL